MLISENTEIGQVRSALEAQAHASTVLAELAQEPHARLVQDGSPRDPTTAAAKGGGGEATGDGAVPPGLLFNLAAAAAMGPPLALPVPPAPLLVPPTPLLVPPQLLVPPMPQAPPSTTPNYAPEKPAGTTEPDNLLANMLASELEMAWPPPLTFAAAVAAAHQTAASATQPSSQKEDEAASAHATEIAQMAMQAQGWRPLMRPKESLLRSRETRGLTRNTLRSFLEDLRSKDPRCIFAARRINRLGFRSKQVLEQHFSKEGEVQQVMVAHSKVRPVTRAPVESSDGRPEGRIRPGNLGLILMKTPEEVESVLAKGPEQIVAGVPILIQRFQRPNFEKEANGNSSSIDNSYVADETTASGSSGKAGSPEPTMESPSPDGGYSGEAANATTKGSSSSEHASTPEVPSAASFLQNAGFNFPPGLSMPSPGVGAADQGQDQGQGAHIAQFEKMLRQATALQSLAWQAHYAQVTLGCFEQWCMANLGAGANLPPPMAAASATMAATMAAAAATSVAAPSPLLSPPPGIMQAQALAKVAQEAMEMSLLWGGSSKPDAPRSKPRRTGEQQTSGEDKTSSQGSGQKASSVSKSAGDMRGTLAQGLAGDGKGSGKGSSRGMPCPKAAAGREKNSVRGSASPHAGVKPHRVPPAPGLDGSSKDELKGRAPYSSWPDPSSVSGQDSGSCYKDDLRGPWSRGSDLRGCGASAGNAAWSSSSASSSTANSTDSANGGSKSGDRQGFWRAGMQVPRKVSFEDRPLAADLSQFRDEDLECVVVVECDRCDPHIGIRQRELLRQHFSQFGEVASVHLAQGAQAPSWQACRNPNTPPRIRSGGLGLVVMRSASAVNEITKHPRVHRMAGLTIRVRQFWHLSPDALEAIDLEEDQLIEEEERKAQEGDIEQQEESSEKSSEKATSGDIGSTYSAGAGQDSTTGSYPSRSMQDDAGSSDHSVGAGSST